jgi:hypothetical protein
MSDADKAALSTILDAAKRKAAVELDCLAWAADPAWATKQAKAQGVDDDKGASDEG